LPVGTEKLKAWLVERWMEKEEILGKLKQNWDTGLAQLQVQ
jgi:hypothetical protein